MFCTKCGAKIADGSAFCTSCGSPVASAGASAASTNPTPATAQAAKKPNAFLDAVKVISKAAGSKMTDAMTGFGGGLSDRRAASLGWKYVLVAFLLFTVLIMSYVPTMKYVEPEYESERVYNDKKEKYEYKYTFEYWSDAYFISAGDPIEEHLYQMTDRNVEESKGTEYYSEAKDEFSLLKTEETLALVTTILPIVLAIAVAILALFKGRVFNMVFMAVPAVVAARVAIGYVVNCFYYTSFYIDEVIGGFGEGTQNAYDMIGKEPHVTYTLAGWLMIPLIIALCATVFFIIKDTMKYGASQPKQAETANTNI